MSKVEIKPTEYEITIVKKYYGKKKANEIADILNVSVNRIYNICRYLNLKHCNLKFIFTELQHQLILGGLLGDGNIKRNGSNYYYRETHSIKEKEYCRWKSSLLEPFLSKSGFHLTDKRDNQYGFQTCNSSSFAYYKKLSIYEIIDQINIFGILIFLLDDGWKRDVSYCVSTGIMTEDMAYYLKKRIDMLFHIDTHIYYKNNEPYCLTIVKKDLYQILPYFVKYIPNDIDIFHNKIQPLRNKLKV